MDGHELVKQTLDQIPQANANAKQIIGLIKKDGKVTGYQLSDNTFVENDNGGVIIEGNTTHQQPCPQGTYDIIVQHPAAEPSRMHLPSKKKKKKNK